ncbi:uncharacterized protein LOC122304841 [Carya illinoinensis]|uniref:uncharacterized protein LOC122304841 n=1 Tax=Carya illinoinensis TaxID=32201 RepID=UPI001C727059|nr:uncharacterized protein LOC122304841 [Carya illinoinensis]
MDEFRNCLEGNNLYDFGWWGVKFTWSNKHIDDSFTKERFDRTIANPQWMELFADRRVKTLVARKSDHKPILLIMNESNCLAGYRRKLFRFEAKWTLEEEGGNIVEAAWARDNAGQNILKKVQGKLRRCRGELIKWSSLKVSDGEKEISRLSELLKKEQKVEGAHNALIIRRLWKELGLLLEKEDLKWK